MTSGVDGFTSSSPSSLYPSFSTSLLGADSLNRRCVSTGRFFGKGCCFAFASGIGIISVRGVGEEQHDQLDINVQRTISHLASCSHIKPVEVLSKESLGEYEGKDLLLIGHSRSIQCFDAENNQQLFYKDIDSNVESLMSLHCRRGDIILVGSVCTIQGFDLKGKETLWILSSGAISSFCNFVSKSGSELILAGDDRFQISSYDSERKGELMWSIQEADVSDFLVGLGHTLFGYGLRNGTIGVYQSTNRLWRVKNRHKLNALESVNVFGMDHPCLVSGWSSGKVEVRRTTNGEILFRTVVVAPVVAIKWVDLRKTGVKDLVVCTADGSLHGFSPTTSLASPEQTERNIRLKEETLAVLNQKSKELVYELEKLETALIKINRNQKRRKADLVGKQELSCCLKHCPDASCILLIVEASCAERKILFKGAIGLGENLFEAESNFVVFQTPRRSLEMKLYPANDIATETSIQVLIKRQSEESFQVLELYQKIPKFAMYALIPAKTSIELDGNIFNTWSADIPESYVSFVTNSSMSELREWKAKNFILAERDRNREQEETTHFCCLRSQVHLVVSFESSHMHQKVAFYCKDIEVIGSMVQDLCQSLGLKELCPAVHLPSVISSLKELLDELEGLNYGCLELAGTVAKRIPLMKSIAVQSEDFRCLRDIPNFKAKMIEMHRMNQEMREEHEKRRVHQELYSCAIKRVSKYLQSVSNVYVGPVRDKIVSDCKDCVRDRNLRSLIRILESHSST